MKCQTLLSRKNKHFCFNIFCFIYFAYTSIYLHKIYMTMANIQKGFEKSYLADVNWFLLFADFFSQHAKC